MFSLMDVAFFLGKTYFFLLKQPNKHFCPLINQEGLHICIQNRNCEIAKSCVNNDLKLNILSISSL